MAAATTATAMDDTSDSTSEDGSELIEDWAKHPVAILWKDWKKANKKEKKTFDFESYRDEFSSYLEGLQEGPFCLDVKGRALTCTCMKDLNMDAEEKQAVLTGLVRFSIKTKVERNYLMAEWIRYSDCLRVDATKRFLLPGGTKPICQHAISRVCGMKSYAWHGLCKKVRTGVALEHGLAGKSPNRLNAQAHDWIDSFLSRLEEQAAPRATRIVRFLNRDGNLAQETRDDDEDILDLPCHCTKLGLYKQFLMEHGWQFVYDPKNRLLDKVAIEGMEQVPNDPTFLPSIKTFLKHWKEEFPKLRIQKAAADICDECFVFANQVRYKERLTGKIGKEALEDDATDDDIPAEAILAKEGDMLATEALIKKAAEHVDKQQKQRKLFNELKQKARSTASKSKPLQTHTFVADFAQNMGVPNLAGEQPGKAYYLSPLNGFVFGIVDCSKEKTTLSAHTYFEHDGKKGGNNVASMLWHELTRKGLTVKGEPVDTINIVMDNCAGQNKNRMVVRLLFILIKLKLCLKARLLFLVKGHTKNDCDRMFNLMKKKYRKSNCYTPKQLLEFVAESSEDVELVDVMKESGFQDWDAYQNKYMRNPDAIKGFHLFSVTSFEPNKLMCQEAYKYPFKFYENVIKKQYRDIAWADNLQKELKVIPPVGMKDIKWITLYDEWRPIVPADLRKDFRCYNTDPGETRRESSKKNREEAAQNRKNRPTTTASVKKRKPSPKPNQPTKKPKASKKQATTTRASAAATKKKGNKKKSSGPFIL
jgi:hypothetical protein